MSTPTYKKYINPPKSSRSSMHFEKVMPDFPMRLNKYIAHKHDMTRAEADKLIEAGRITVNGKPAILGCTVIWSDVIEVAKK